MAWRTRAVFLLMAVATTSAAACRTPKDPNSSAPPGQMGSWPIEKTQKQEKGTPAGQPDRTAATRAVEEAKAAPEVPGNDTTYIEPNPADAKGKSWAGWRYQGDRGTCFYVVGRRCVEKAEEACKLAKCAETERCAEEGTGPVVVSCKTK